VVELGRYIVGECGVYVTRVVDRKESRGKTFLVVDGGLHHQLAASGNFGQVIRRNYPLAVGHPFRRGAHRDGHGRRFAVHPAGPARRQC
jgi:diaminopimelate decarboxylase